MRAIGTLLTSVLVGLAAGCVSPSQPAWTEPFPGVEAPGARDDTPQELANRRVVLDYYHAANNAKDFAAASRLVSLGIKLHDPELSDGLGGLEARIRALIAEHPQSNVDVKRVLTSGDQVFLHSHAVRTPGTAGFIAGDVFRLENGRVVEQWSVLHAIPEKPHADNPNGPF